MTAEEKKTLGIDDFAERLDEIFAQGMPTKAQIYDAYNKAVDKAYAAQHKEMMLREELIKYDHWAARHLICSSEVLTAEQAVDAYLEELKNVKK